MYLGYWKLNISPFENAPTKGLFYKSTQHEEALLRLVYAVEHQKGLAVLTGEVGTGKTTISRVMMEYVDNDGFEVLTLVNPVLEPVDLIRALLIEMDEPHDDPSKIVLLNRLNQRLLRNFDHDIKTVLIIDEAHLIKKKSMLEELRMLLNLNRNDQFLMTLILMGQLPLSEVLSGLPPLKERIAIRYDLKPLDKMDTARYILHRLKSAGATRGIFTREGIEKIFAYSRGFPLRINNLCDRCLLVGMMQKAKIADSGIVDAAVADLQQR